MFADKILGFPIPHAGVLFGTVLALHVASGLTGIVAGALAATARKRPGRHPRAGRVYLWAAGAVLATTIGLVVVRARHDAYLIPIGLAAFSLGLYGFLAHRQSRPGWPGHHAIAMGGSYVALLTGFAVNDGRFLPLVGLLPRDVYWVLPAAIAAPLIWLALHRFRRAGRFGSLTAGSGGR